MAVCSHNRARSLETNLPVVASRLRPGDELLVVDNASDDDTQQVLRDLRRVLPALRVASEPQLGVSHARNRAVDSAHHDIVAFVDDDAVTGPGWADAIAQVFDDPKVAVAGGPVALRFPGARPPWMHRRLEVLLSGYDRGDEPLVLEPGDTMPGANLAVRRSALDGFRFSGDLGYVGRQPRFNEEHPLFAWVQSQGVLAVYEPAAKVEHVVPAHRLRLGYFIGRSYAQGSSDARLHQLVPATQVPASTRARRAARQIPTLVLPPDGGLRPALVVAGVEAIRLAGNLRQRSARRRQR